MSGIRSLTRLSGVTDELKGLEMGAVDYITKPYVREVLLTRMRIHLIGITENTTKSALKNIYGKLNIHSKLKLAELDLGD
jgi:DNA-binding response OmpR family regulator